MKKNENGRSMVEMLGVLAIIGVLSVGALAGYSKAMTQHKLNKNAEEIGYLLSVAIYNNDKLKNASSNMYAELNALGAYTWPAELKGNPQEGYYILDTLQNKIGFEHYAHGGTAIRIELPSSDFAVKVCANYINVFKSFADDLDMVYVSNFNLTEGTSSHIRFAGKGCTTGKCLKDITNADIVPLCTTHCVNAEYCDLYALWDYPASTVAGLLGQ